MKSPSLPGVAQAIRDGSMLFLSTEVLKADGCADGETGESLLAQQQFGFSERHSNRREYVSLLAK